MAELKLPYALDATDRMVSAEQVPRGAACGCRCPECFAALISKQGEVLRWHFAHVVDPDGTGCANAFETMVHRLAKQTILDAGYVDTPIVVARHLRQRQNAIAGRRLTFTVAHAEMWLGDIRRRPDVLMETVDAGSLAIEIHVAHASPPEKRAAFAERGLAAIEIDLSQYRNDLPADFQAMVLTTAPRAWLFHPHQALVNSRLARDMAEQAQAAAERQAEREAAEKEAREAQQKAREASQAAVRALYAADWPAQRDAVEPKEPDPRDWVDLRTPEELAARRRELAIASARSAVEALEAAPAAMKGRDGALLRAQKSLALLVHS